MIMRYFKKEDFDKCMEFLADKPDTVETQQELYKFMHEECRMMPVLERISVKNMTVYAKVYETSIIPKTANWCSTMNNGSQVVWNRKHKSFYIIDEIGMNRCSYTDYTDMFTEINGIDTWLLENWSNWSFREMQKQLIAIFNGKFNQYYMNFWRRNHD